MRELTQRQAASPETTSIPQPEWFEHKALGYAIAIAGTALSALLRWGLGQTVGHQIPPYITFYPAVILSALVGGTGPGLLATLLSALTVDLCFLGPFGRFGIVHSADAVGLGLFGLINIAMSVVGGRLRAARLKIRADAR